MALTLFSSVTRPLENLLNTWVELFPSASSLNAKLG